MSSFVAEHSDLALFLNIIHALENVGAPYVIIGIFGDPATYTHGAAEIVVVLDDALIENLIAALPSPRYHLDANEIIDAIVERSAFDVVDSERDKCTELIPLAMPSPYLQAFRGRIRLTLAFPDADAVEAWVARAEDVIVARLAEWEDARDAPDEAGVYEIVRGYYETARSAQSVPFDEAYVDNRVQAMSAAAVQLWRRSKAAARERSSE